MPKEWLRGISPDAMTCTYCQTENAEAGKTCQSCGMAIDVGPALALVPPVGVIPNETAPHPFAHPRRTQIFNGIKNAVTAMFMVPTMAIIGGILGVLFFAIVIGILDHLYFQPDLSRYYLGQLARKSLMIGLFAGIPTGAYASVAAASAFIKNAGKMLTGFCVLLALPFLIFPPFHFFPHMLRISSTYHLPSGITGGFLLALPFLVFIKFYHSMFTSALASRRSGK
jgi:hypothetical protein